MMDPKEQVSVNLKNGTYIEVDVKDSPSAHWKKFRKVVDRSSGQVVLFPKAAPCGYAVCRMCREICPLGRRGGMSPLEKHRCHKLKADSKWSAKPIEKKSDKNAAEKERKEEIAALIKDVACIILGQDYYNKNNFLLQELTKLRLVRATLSELPFSILQFVSDGKLPVERTPQFYAQLVKDTGELFTKAIQAEAQANEQYKSTQQQDSFMPADLAIPSQVVHPNLHLRLSYPAPGDDNIDITWVSSDVEKNSLGFNRMNIIGRSLSDLIHSDDYSHIKAKLLSSDSRETKDFGFPECRVAEPQRRSKSPIEHRKVFLSCTIRVCPRASREKENVLKLPEQNMNLVSRQPVAIADWPRLALFFKLPTHYRYMTLHSLDGCIIQADERITMVTGYSCDEVMGKLAYQYIPESSTFYVKQAREKWLERENQVTGMGDLARESAVVSYPLRCKKESIIYLRSQGELVRYRDERTMQLIDGFILVNSLIDKQEYLDDMNQSLGYNSSPSDMVTWEPQQFNHDSGPLLALLDSFSSDSTNEIATSLSSTNVARHLPIVNSTTDNHHLASFSGISSNSSQIFDYSSGPQTCISSFSPVTSLGEFRLNEISIPSDITGQHYPIYGCGSENNPVNEAIFIVDEQRTYGGYRDL